jgi:chromosome segregation ATPase
MPGEEVVSYGQAARALGISKRTLHRLITSGKLERVETLDTNGDNRGYVTRASFDQVRNERHDTAQRRTTDGTPTSSDAQTLHAELLNQINEERNERRQVAEQAESLRERERHLTELLSESEREYESQKHELETERQKLEYLIAFGSWSERRKARKSLRHKLSDTD